MRKLWRSEPLSSTRTLRPRRVSAAARLADTNVLPTPPLPLVMATTLPLAGLNSGPGASGAGWVMAEEGAFIVAGLSAGIIGRPDHGS